MVDQPHIQCAAIDPCGHLSSNRVGSAKGGRVMSRAHVDLFRVHENYCATDLMGVRN
nr:hypothetical protein [Sphingobium sp. YR768]